MCAHTRVFVCTAFILLGVLSLLDTWFGVGDSFWKISGFSFFQERKTAICSIGSLLWNSNYRHAGPLDTAQSPWTLSSVPACPPLCSVR